MKNLKKGDDSYEFIGHLALALYSIKIKLQLSTLQKILNDEGADYGGGIGMGKVVSTAYTYWDTKKQDTVIAHAIASIFIGKTGCLHS
jgi:hypothetical protein